MSSPAVQASHGEGTVVATTTNCSDLYVIQTSSGYVIAEWRGGRVPNVGDRVYGNLDSSGVKDLVLSGAASVAYIDDYGILSGLHRRNQSDMHGCPLKAASNWNLDPDDD